MTDRTIETGPPAASGSGQPTSESTTPGDGQGTADVAKDEARSVARDATDSGRHVVGVAKDEAKNVASEAGHQAKALLDQARSELTDQASTQQKRVAEGLHSLSQELGAMAAKSEEPGLATDLAQQASRQLGEISHWLDKREPGSLVTELKAFARNKPGTFLAVAAGLGLVAGRLSRGLAAEHKDDTGSGGFQAQEAGGANAGTATGRTAQLPSVSADAPPQARPVTTPPGPTSGTSVASADYPGYGDERGPLRPDGGIPPAGPAR